MARRLVVLLAVMAALMGGLLAHRATAATSSVTSDFKFVNGLLLAAGVDCDPATYYVCGIGEFDGQAAVTRVEYPTNQRLLLDEGCALYDTVEVVTLLDGSGSSSSSTSTPSSAGRTRTGCCTPRTGPSATRSG